MAPKAMEAARYAFASVKKEPRRWTRLFQIGRNQALYVIKQVGLAAFG